MSDLKIFHARSGVIPDNQHTLTATQGTDVSWVFTHYGDDGLPADVTAPEMQVRYERVQVADPLTDETLVLDLTEGAGLTLGVPGSGEIMVQLTAVQTAMGVTVPSYRSYTLVFDLFGLDADGDAIQVARGYLVLRPRVTVQ